MPYIAIIVLILLILLGVFAVYAGRIKQKAFEKTGKYPKGHYMGIGIALGIPLGLPIGIAMDNISVGPAIGVAIGVAIGAALEKKHEKELRELTPAEEDLRNKGIAIAAVLALLGLIAFVTLYFLSGK